MGRPEIHYVDYFPFYARDGRTLFLLEEKYGCTGTGFFTNVLRFLSLTHDHHFCIADEADRDYFFAKCKMDPETGMDMLAIMAKTGKINSGIFREYSAIASEDLLNSIQDAYRKRKTPCITMQQIKNLYAQKHSEKQDKEEFPAECSGGKAECSAQSKEKKSKENIKESASSDAAPQEPNEEEEKTHQHYSKVVGEFLPKLDSLADSFKTLPHRFKRLFNPWQYIQKFINDGYHPQVINDALQQIFKYWNTIDDDPWSYSRKFIHHDQKNKEAEGWKKMKPSDMAPEVQEALNAFFNRMRIVPQGETEKARKEELRRQAARITGKGAQ